MKEKIVNRITEVEDLLKFMRAKTEEKSRSDSWMGFNDGFIQRLKAELTFLRGLLNDLKAKEKEDGARSHPGEDSKDNREPDRDQKLYPDEW